MATMRAVQKLAEERRQLARQLLQQHQAMIRMQLTPTEWLCFKLGCSLAVAEKLIEEIAEEKKALVAPQQQTPVSFCLSRCCGVETDFVARNGGAKDRRRCRQCGGEQVY